MYQCPLSSLSTLSHSLYRRICTDAHTSYIEVCPPISLCNRGFGYAQTYNSDKEHLDSSIREFSAPRPCRLQPLHLVYSRQVAYRLTEVPTDSTLERVEAGIPHIPCRLELNSSGVMNWLCLTTIVLLAVAENFRTVGNSSVQAAGLRTSTVELLHGDSGYDYGVSEAVIPGYCVSCRKSHAWCSLHRH